MQGIRGGSYQTIAKYLREWKELEDNDAPIKDYPIPDLVRKQFDRMRQDQWNAFLRFYEPIIENEIITELEKENESLRAQLEVAKQDKIRLEESEKIRKEQSERYERAMQQQRNDAIEIEQLTSQLKELTSSF